MSGELVHATSLVVGTTGILITGPSGCGKSALALRLIENATLRGRYARLVSDDQTRLTESHGRLIASAPTTIRGLIESRGAGVLGVETVEAAVMDVALEPVTVTAENRIPEDDRRWTSPGGAALPLLSLDRALPDPFAVLMRLIGTTAPARDAASAWDCLKS
ncbi:HPr kinase/phosphorylase [Rhizobium sp. G21]|uniref:HPr kinase/phosphorylase n=1 Tax=Rhizobium sp. G21 TaxID=2758439 RepID=UPI001602F7C5|nr:HPr kinase/phosphorylase [Rhizobium sp. G21]MBB1249463.1 HPr kinase/phosphorylase [Rhizobium sp. G21]